MKNIQIITHNEFHSQRRNSFWPITFGHNTLSTKMKPEGIWERKRAATTTNTSSSFAYITQIVCIILCANPFDVFFSIIFCQRHDSVSSFFGYIVAVIEDRHCSLWLHFEVCLHIFVICCLFWIPSGCCLIFFSHFQHRISFSIFGLQTRPYYPLYILSSFFCSHMIQFFSENNKVISFILYFGSYWFSGEYFFDDAIPTQL